MIQFVARDICKQKSKLFGNASPRALPWLVANVVCSFDRQVNSLKCDVDNNV
jgi:hypothetical protein